MEQGEVMGLEQGAVGRGQRLALATGRAESVLCMIPPYLHCSEGRHRRIHWSVVVPSLVLLG